MSKYTSYNYFTFFQDMIACGCQSASLLKEVIDDYQYAELESYREQMHKIEHAADLKKHEMMEHLMKEFLPPIDREDILTIAEALDNVCDCIEDVLLLMYMNNIQNSRSDIAGMTSIIVNLCDELKELFAKFSKFKSDSSLKKHIIAVNAVEEDGDRLYIEAMRNLVIDGTDLAQIILWRDIYNCLENCCDSCEAVADAVEAVIMKNT